MKKLLFILLVSLLMAAPTKGQAIQGYDTIIKFTTYKAFYSDSIQTSSFVVYKLYKPKVKVSREGFNFRKYQYYPHFDYSHTVYDKGHLVPAADRSASKRELEETFYYINAVPQHKSLNRGSWKKLETAVRNLSMKDSLLIVCGGCDWHPADSLIPENCFKVVYSLSKRSPIYYRVFRNDSGASVRDDRSLLDTFPLEEVERLLRGSK